MNYLNLLDECTLCHRNCKVNRNNNQLGFCKASNKVKIARAALHFGEEPPISQGNGSGTVFFSHCNFNCVFCQNHDISQETEENISSNFTSNDARSFFSTKSLLSNLPSTFATRFCSASKGQYIFALP